MVGPQGPVGAPLRPHHSITTATFTTTSGQSHGKDRIQHHLDILSRHRHAHANTRGSAHKSHQLCIAGNLLTKTRGAWRGAAYVSRSFLVLASSWACCGRMLAVPRMVAISPCMKAHGTDDPARGHRSPLGQYTCGKHQEAVSRARRHGGVYHHHFKITQQRIMSTNERQEI